MKFDFDFPSSHEDEDGIDRTGYQYVEAIIMVKFITLDGEIGWFRSRTDGVNIWEAMGVLDMVKKQDLDWAAYGTIVQGEDEEE